jgi:hypothetical protein
MYRLLKSCLDILLLLTYKHMLKHCLSPWIDGQQKERQERVGGEAIIAMGLGTYI